MQIVETNTGLTSSYPGQFFSSKIDGENTNEANTGSNVKKKSRKFLHRYQNKIVLFDI